MHRLSPPSPRVLARVVAGLLVTAVVSLPVVDDEDRGGQVAATGAATPSVEEEPSDPVVEAGLSPSTTHPADGGAGGVPTLRTPRVPKVTVPSVTVPTIPPVTVPPLLDARATAACKAAANAPAVGGDVLSEEGVYTAAPDGSGVRRMAKADDPGTWDAPHRRLAYQVPLDPITHALCVLEGGAAKAVGTFRPLGGFAAPAAHHLWASGNRLAVINDGGRTPGLRLYDVGTGAVAREVAGVYPHDISPDGRWLAFVAGDKLPQRLTVVDLDSGAVRTSIELDQEKYMSYQVRWLPDGSGVAYLSESINAVDVATGTRRVLVREAGGGSPGGGSYAFARDGRIAYSTYLGGEDQGRTYVAAPDGSNPVQVADGQVSFLAWSPAGDRLLLGSGYRNEASLQVVKPDGSERRTLLRAAAKPGEHWLRFALNNAWAPDGSRIAFGLWRHPAADSVAT